MRRSPLPLAALLLVACATTVQGQGLRSRISQLFTFGNCGQPLCLDGSVNAQNGHGDHYLPAAAEGNSTIIAFIIDAIGTNIANIPVGATSSGATFELVDGLPVRTSESSGPIFGERAQTLGRGRVTFGANVTAMSFATIRGTPLDELRFTFTHQDVGSPGLGEPPLEKDLIDVRTWMDINLVVASLYATYGITDRLDVGVAIPLVHTSIRGESTAQVIPFGDIVHFFSGTPEDPVLAATAHANGSATGMGDVVLRAKLNLNEARSAAFSLLTEAHLPTGDEDNLLGAGAMSLRALGVFSARLGDFSPHANVGAVYRDSELQNSALVANIGFDQLLAPWATFAFDVLSEWQLGRNKLEIPEDVSFRFPIERTVEPTNIQNRRDDLIGISVGAKLRMDSGATGIINLIVPVGSGGLRPRAIWSAGLEYAL